MTYKPFKVFISSVQKELEQERKAVKAYLHDDPLMKRFFDVFLFEDLPASNRKAAEVYLKEVENCDVYIGLFGNKYGSEGQKEVSPTEREFDHATTKGKTRLIFVKGTDDKSRHPKMLKLIHKAGSQLIRRRFSDIPDLKATLYASLVEYLEQNGKISALPFDASACPRAEMEDLSEEKLRIFLGTAKRERNYTLSEKTPLQKALTHLKLLDQGKPTHAAILLFGKYPQRFLITSEVKCLHYHGTEVRKPIPSYQIYKGTVFELVDQAVDFVLSKINRSIGTREQSIQAPAKYELPQEAVKEAIVNAVAHRDYASNASVQVMLFADRLEVWNPGELPPGLTPELLREPHASIPRNPLLAEPFYLARYIEKVRSGTLDMIARCKDDDLPEPDFEQRGGQWVVTLWRDWLTAKLVSRMNLNERQMKAISYIKVHGRITNKDYREMTSTIIRTASRDIEELVSKGLLRKVGTTGRNIYYVFARKQDIKRTNRT
jgi:predicted HTH transcriptional regulator